MIDPQWSVVDLDPTTWRALGPFFDPGQYVRAAQPDEHGLFVLHAGGRILRVVDTERGVRRDLDLASAADPQALAAGLYAQGEWQRVHVIDKRHLAAVAREAQATPRRDLAIDAYYHLVFRLVWGLESTSPDGYVSVPPHPGHWHGWTYTDLRAQMARLPDPATVALAVVDGAALIIGLILDVQDGLIHTVTTFDTFGLPPPALAVAPESLARLWVLLEARHQESGTPHPAVVLLCTPAAFETWREADDKPAALAALSRQGQAFWRVEGA